MIHFRTFVIFAIVIFLSTCGLVLQAQEATSANPQATGFTEVMQQVNENQAKEKKKDKKKDKLKEEIQINEKFYVNILIDLLTLIIIVVLIYYPNYHKKDVFFTFFLFNLSIFLLTFLLNEVKISMGAAFGLFAVFSMLRYRTEGISMKDMTYLFIVIAIGLVSAIQLEYYELAIINGIFIVATYALDGNILLKREYSKIIQYERIEYIKPENREKLLDDLRERTGLDIHRISIDKIDFLRDMATMEAFYYKEVQIVKEVKIKK